MTRAAAASFDAGRWTRRTGWRPTARSRSTATSPTGARRTSGRSTPSYSPPGSRFFATVADGSFVFALKTTGLATAGAHILIDSDRNDGSGTTAHGVYNESLVKYPPGGAYYTIANGVDFDIRFDSAGHPQLYRGDGTLLGPLAYAANGDTIEFAVPQHLLGGAQPADVTLEFYDGLYGVGYVPADLHRRGQRHHLRRRDPRRQHRRLGALRAHRLLADRPRRLRDLRPRHARTPSRSR